MKVFKLEFIKEFDADLKQLLSIDKKYLPIQKKLAVVLRSMNPFFSELEKGHQLIKDQFIQRSLQINRHYAENMENFQRSLGVLIAKNQEEIDKSQKIKYQKTHELNLNLKAQLETIETKVSQIESEAKEKLDKADQVLKRELAQVQKVMLEARKIYQETTKQIELEQVEAHELLLRRYDENIQLFDQEETKIKNSVEVRLQVIREDSQRVTEANDQSYLTIKNTYSQLSISINKKINELKKKYQNALNKLEKEHQEKLKPILKSIEELKVNFQETQQKSLNAFTEKMNSLSVIFDVQKTAYENKKERIIHEGNDQITLLNSKLSSYRETTQKEKLIKSREMRDEMKSIEDEYEKEKKNHQLTQMLNQFDNELNKQIIRTNKDILIKKKEMHKRLLELDHAHLKEINEWRLKKVLYEYEKKQDFAKIDLNFNHNLSASELMQKSEELTFANSKEILLQEHNLELLPLEFQLLIAAAVQERELNLLANDAHVTIAAFKHQEALLDFDIKKALEKIRLNRDLEKAHFEADLSVLNATTQLELEKEKLKRDYTIAEQELRTELSHAIFNKQKQAIQYDLNTEITEIDLERDLAYLENKHSLDQFKHDALIEEAKRVFIVNEGRYKHQQRMSNEKATRLLLTYQNELEYNQMMTESFFQVIYKFYGIDRIFKDALVELYHLPSHPEVFKGMLDFIMRIIHKNQEAFYQIVEFYQQLDQEFYIKKIEDLTGYKYMLKHEDMMNYFEQEIQKVIEKKKMIEQDIQTLEDSFFMSQGDLERTTVRIEQLNAQLEGLKSNHKSETKHQDLKELHKELSNSEHELKRIRGTLSRLQKQMDRKHLKLSPLDDQISKLTKKQKDQEAQLAKSKHQEASIFYTYLSKDKHTYEKITKDINTYIDQMNTFYHTLYNEVYVSDSFLKEKSKIFQVSLTSFEKKLSVHFQDLLKLMLAFYDKNKKEQSQLTLGFRKSTTALIRSLNLNYTKQLEDLDIDQGKQENEYMHQVKIARLKNRKKQELSKISYQKSLLMDQHILKLLEKKLSDNSTRRENDLNLIQENQVANAEQYQHDHEVKKNELIKEHDKLISTMEQNMQTATKNHESLDQSITNKNEAILAKYETNHDKSMTSYKSKAKHIDEVIQKTHMMQQEHIDMEKKMLKRMNDKRENELKNINQHLDKFTRQMKRQQNHTLNKELKLLRKTYNSKVRMLHLT